MSLFKIPLASHQISHSTQTVHPAVDVYVGGIWAMTLFSNLPTIVGVITGILASVYYGICIWDKLKERKLKQ